MLQLPHASYVPVFGLYIEQSGRVTLFSKYSCPATTASTMLKLKSCVVAKGITR